MKQIQCQREKREAEVNDIKTTKFAKNSLTIKANEELYWVAHAIYAINEIALVDSLTLVKNRL